MTNKTSETPYLCGFQRFIFAYALFLSIRLKVYNYKYNKFPMRPLYLKVPADYIMAFLINGEIF